jgi:hypothetical protein
MPIARCQLQCEIPQNPIELRKVLSTLLLLIFRPDRFCDVSHQPDIFDGEFVDIADGIVQEAGTEQQSQREDPSVVVGVLGDGSKPFRIDY